MTVSNARLAAELQAVAIGIHLVGLDRLPEVMRPVSDNADTLSVGISQREIDHQNPGAEG
jgi:hypothetical protein